MESRKVASTTGNCSRHNGSRSGHDMQGSALQRSMSDGLLLVPCIQTLGVPFTLRLARCW